MSYFDNANNQVTRKSFGSKVDKEFKREGVIPVRDRSKKDNSLTEAATKYTELNKQVDARRLKDLKEQKAFDAKMQEGYTNLKEDLIKDFITEICVESLLVDEDVVNDNLKNIIEMVERQVDDIGGFDGIKHIAETYNNPILKNMVSICEGTAKKVGERNMKESKCDSSKVNFCLNKIELDEYDYRKKEMGSETIVNNIKDKVFQVVQDEQKLNNDKQMIMDEIHNKVSEIEAPVEEAMSFIFESNRIEEDTLFNSLMRNHYKQLLQTNSSAIFESYDYKEMRDPLFEDDEFSMSDINMNDIDDEDKAEIEDIFLKETKYLYDTENYNYESILENFYKLVEEGSLNIKSYVHAEHFKSIVRKVQNELEYIKENYVQKTQPKNKKTDDRYTKFTTESSVEIIKNKLNKFIEEADAIDGDVANMPKESDLEKNMKDSSTKKVSEEVILCPTCGKEECVCKVAKESNETTSQLIEQYIDKFEDICECMNNVMNSHDVAKNNVTDSLNKNIGNNMVFVPYLQANDVNLSNLEFIYKTKLVCESLKDNLKIIETEQEANTLKKAVDMNITSINETLELIGSREDMAYKVKILNTGKNYLNKINNTLENNSDTYNDVVVESTSVYSTPDDVERIFNIAKEYVAIESTNNDLMELVMAEAIVDYTILETFNTLYLMKFTKDSVRQMARKNITK